ncbi:hypothetical protein ASD11_06480 [Aeromicrobium sp. Root495]|uniref:DUF881 domain-containing protein n=1 Tax=Aeromicrobium sp. Root495 TaxID=1736550 RepID=UPI0006F9FE9E|nr:DUF881 domain-containing protein [Aeromicrobium sp. Root495]KQY59225.1 hypothetical protein ASD11_06480 [Aeromicrobium sp. Root495]
MPEPRTGRALRVVSGLLVAALAYAVTVQVRQDEESDYSTLRGVELVELLKSIDAANQRLGRQIDELTATRNGLQSSNQSSEEATKQARKRAAELAILAGTVAASGPGIQITVSDPQRVVDAALVLDTVEELRDAGAEVIAMNGTARIVAQTYFLDDEDGIRVSGTLVKAPYTIDVIGDAATLEEAATFRGGIVDRFTNRGAAAEVDKRGKITITALADARRPQYSRATSDE